jgi:hypothetical protein
MVYLEISFKFQKNLSRFSSKELLYGMDIPDKISVIETGGVDVMSTQALKYMNF